MHCIAVLCYAVGFLVMFLTPTASTSPSSGPTRTLTETGPSECAGDVHVSTVSEYRSTRSAAASPNLTCGYGIPWHVSWLPLPCWLKGRGAGELVMHIGARETRAAILMKAAGLREAVAPEAED